MQLTKELYKEFESFHASQTRPMSTREAAWAFVDAHNLPIDPDDFVNFVE